PDHTRVPLPASPQSAQEYLRAQYQCGPTASAHAEQRHHPTPPPRCLPHPHRRGQSPTAASARPAIGWPLLPAASTMGSPPALAAVLLHAPCLPYLSPKIPAPYLNQSVLAPAARPSMPGHPSQSHPV